ncbi:hypothetical protein BD626DRAFT_565812 [Schizophyllum amplum]|uniref:Uncharacterized protein n=1 Tax=Schizophyllum amplum TaxID=97359 RepID=A0A550CPJ6_9AGAR|nr:hypothetical protein BD626DRAFT_565812 [Auriculariopsis ampla]
MAPRNASPTGEFPWESLKAETLRSMTADLVSGSGASSQIARNREGAIAFMKSVVENGVEEAIRQATQANAASTSARTASASAPVKRKREEDSASASRSTRSKGLADYPYSTRNQGKPAKSLEQLGISLKRRKSTTGDKPSVGPKATAATKSSAGPKASASAKPGPKPKSAAAKKSTATSKPGPASRKGRPRTTKPTSKAPMVFDGVEIPRSSSAAVAGPSSTVADPDPTDSISQNGDEEEEDEGNGDQEKGGGGDQEEGGSGDQEEDGSGEQEEEDNGDQTVMQDEDIVMDGPAAASSPSTSSADPDKENAQPVPAGDFVEATPSEGAEATPSEGVEATPSEGVEATPSEAASSENPFAPTVEIVEGTPSEGAEATPSENPSPSETAEVSTALAEVSTAMEDPYVGGEEDANGEPESEPASKADEGPMDASNEDNMVGIELDTAAAHPIPAV